VSPEGGDGSIEVEELLASGGILGFLKKVIGTNYVPYGFNPQELIQPDDLVLNLGSGVADGKSPSTVNLDYFLFPFVDVVADAHNIPFEDSFFDVVLSEFMIEHVKDPSRVCSEISRVLKPGGTLYVSYPFIHPYHSFPNDYFRFTHSGLQAIFAGMEVIREGPLTGPACRWIGATADIFTFWIKVAKVRIAMRALILALLSPMKFLDLAFNRLPESKCHAVTLFSILRKKGTD
jgi:SAM-dependent methyltransferase